MKAVVFRDIGDIRLENVPDPKLEQSTDAIVRITASAICGTDLHLVRGTVPGMKPGTILGHEGVGVVAELGPDVRNLKVGDRVVIASTIGCGYCAYCRDGYYSQCDNANPRGPTAGTATYGGPTETGSFPGLQAELARIPFANVGALRLPNEITDDQAILLSDIFPTGYFGARLAQIRPGHTVAVFGCGPAGQFAIASARMMGAGRILAIDTIPSRLEMACAQGAETIDFMAEDPVKALLRLTGGIGVDRAIDAVGIDAVTPGHGPGARSADEHAQFARELHAIAPHTKPKGDNWHPGGAPSQVFQWAVEGLAKAGTLSIIGLYPPGDHSFPIGKAMNKNLTVNMGNCNHRKYLPELIEIVQAGLIDPASILSQREPLSSAIEAYKAFDLRRPGWLKVKLEPVALAA